MNYSWPRNTGHCPGRCSRLARVRDRSSGSELRTVGRWSNPGCWDGYASVAALESHRTLEIREAEDSSEVAVGFVGRMALLKVDS